MQCWAPGGYSPPVNFNVLVQPEENTQQGDATHRTVAGHHAHCRGPARVHTSLCDKPRQLPVCRLRCAHVCAHIRRPRLPCSRDHPPCDKIDLKVKRRASEMSSPLRVNVSLLEHPCPSGSIARSLSAISRSLSLSSRL